MSWRFRRVIRAHPRSARSRPRRCVPGSGCSSTSPPAPGAIAGGCRRPPRSSARRKRRSSSTWRSTGCRYPNCVTCYAAVTCSSTIRSCTRSGASRASHPRISSHHRDIDKKLYPDFGMRGPVVREKLHGRTAHGTWVQLEKTPAAFGKGKLPSLDDLRHLMDYVTYRITRSNVGPWGLSRMTERHPMYLSPDLAVPTPLTPEVAASLTSALHRIEEEDDTTCRLGRPRRRVPAPGAGGTGRRAGPDTVRAVRTGAVRQLRRLGDGDRIPGGGHDHGSGSHGATNGGLVGGSGADVSDAATGGLDLTAIKPGPGRHSRGPRSPRWWSWSTPGR